MHKLLFANRFNGICFHYKESEVCLNEMGAAWVLSGKVQPVILPPINFNTVGVLQEPNQIEKLLDEKCLDRIRDRVQEKLLIPPERIASDRWTQKKKEFIVTVNNYIENTPFPVPMDRAEYNNLIESNQELNRVIANLILEKHTLEKQVKDLEKAKDKKEVNAIREKYHPSSELDEFVELSQNIEKSLKVFPTIIAGIIFKTYNNKTKPFDTQPHRNEIQQADAEDFIHIDEDNETIEADWETTRTMTKVYEKLNELDNFMRSTLSDTFYNEYESLADATFSIENKSFWEKAFKVQISIN